MAVERHLLMKKSKRQESGTMNEGLLKFTRPKCQINLKVSRKRLQQT